MTTLQNQILQAESTEQLEAVLENAEPRQSNGFETELVRNLKNSLWYDPLDLEKQKENALRICKFYGK